jgi:RHS repeat-associated protein
VVSAQQYYPFGMLMPGGSAGVRRQYTLGGNDYRYGFNGKEGDDEVKGDDNQQDYGMRISDPRIGRFLSVDPLAGKMPSWSPYCYGMDNPIMMIDPDGQRPFPVNALYKGEPFRIDSWFGPRNVEDDPKASKNHKGLDINFGGGRFDYGAPVLTTHDGVVSLDESTKGGEGRSIIVTSPDGKFRTKYFHLSGINVKEGQKVSESDVIGEIGSSAFGSETGTKSHLHYEIQTFDQENNKWLPFNPTQGNANSKDNVVDPQTWITPEPTQSNDIFTPVLMEQDNTRVNIVLPIIKKEEVKK